MEFVFLEPRGLVREGITSFMDCIRFFEEGAEAIYLVEEDGRYRWRSAQRVPGCITRGHGNEWQIVMKPTAPIFLSHVRPENHDKSLEELTKTAFQQMPEMRELPVVDGGGKNCTRSKDTGGETTIFGLGDVLQCTGYYAKGKDIRGIYVKFSVGRFY